MKTLITVLLSAISLTILFGSPSPQTEPEVTVPGIVSTSNDNGGMRTLADTPLPALFVAFVNGRSGNRSAVAELTNRKGK